MAQYTITYFPVRARSQSVRFLLADQGCEWKEDVVPIEPWYQGKDDRKKSMAFGQLPMFTDGDFRLFQSNAILRYLARKHYLYGKNDKEAALIDMVNDGAEDLRIKFFRFFFQEWDTGKEKYMEEMPDLLSPFERILSKNSSGFLVGSTISFADYSLLDVLYNHVAVAPDCLKSFPLLQAYYDMMVSRPKLKVYLESEDHKNCPMHPARTL
ncbi:glutathione S-transferase P 1-like [Ambystoma mexicanum]|uniref:glutathione S-transferase P 1-like n=1 Tax=Ambystoma mexicanum TaxID=8296 RepID=UPI0037E86BE4